MSPVTLAPEWERQDAMILVWPHANSDWSTHLASIEKTYCELAYRINASQQLIIIAYDLEHEAHIRDALSHYSVDEKKLLFISIATNDTWIRDYGPLCVKSDNGNKVLDFKFDAWGKKYAYEKDNALTTKLLERLNITAACEHIDFILEGGNIEVNAKHELLSSLRCFSRQNNLDINQLEKNLHAWFGIQRVYWLDCGKLEGDDTDGHIDTLARFCADDVIVYSAANTTDDPNTKTLQALQQQLENIQHLNQHKFELIPLPVPEPIYHNNQQLPASYTNFTITNQQVLVPTFDDKQDDYALQTMQDIFPSREVIGINSVSMIQQFGGLHCATMHLPENTLIKA